MPTKERREVAERLRDAAELPEENILAALADICGINFNSGGNVTLWRSTMTRLADLIDPTCDAGQDYDRDEPIQGRRWKCDVCGEHFIYERGFAPRFCPECGARVVNE